MSPTITPMTKRTLITAAGIFISIVVGCDRGEGGGGSKPGAGPTTSSTQATESAAVASAPRIGIPHGTKETYKPVVGKYGGRIVHDHLGEPKSFNPIVSSETSTSDYTQ